MRTIKIKKAVYNSVNCNEIKDYSNRLNNAVLKISDEYVISKLNELFPWKDFTSFKINYILFQDIKLLKINTLNSGCDILGDNIIHLTYNDEKNDWDIKLSSRLEDQLNEK